MTGEAAEWPIFDRVGPACGVGITGPANVAKGDTSTLIGPGWRATVNRLGYIELTR